MRLHLQAAVIATALCLAAGQAAAGSLAGVPLKDAHLKAMGQAAACSVCHGAALPKTRPSDKACIGCHGTMDKIPTPDNKWDKKPQDSPHYGDTLECTECHAEHKAGKALCNACHVAEWKRAP